jgi:NAD(P)H-flavin reductase
MVPCPYEVGRITRETKDTFTLIMRPAEGPAMTFRPGQFNMLYAFGIGEVPISISGDPEKPEPLVHTIRAVGAATRALCSAKRGTVLGVRGPYGTPWPLEEARGKDVVIVAGGVGLAPVRPIIYHLLAHRREYGRLALLYGARTPADFLYRRELHEWRGRFDINVEVTVDHAAGQYIENVGVVTTLVAGADFDPDETVAFVCGPEIMMRFSVLELKERGVPAENIYISMERNMKCAIGLCGHCQFGPSFVCKDGPVFRYTEAERFFVIREV